MTFKSTYTNVEPLLAKINIPTVSPARRLTLFISGLLLFVTVFECFVRRHDRLFAAASHRALAKAAMFDLHPQAKLLFLGTSRTQDGVSPVLVTRKLGEIGSGPGALPGYNAAFTGSGIDALMSLATRFSTRTGLRLVVIELSGPQLKNEPAPWEQAEPPLLTLEDHLTHLLRHLHLVRYRYVFLSDNLGRLPALLFFAPSLSGWETKGSDQVASWLGRREKSATGFEPARWQPRVWGTNTPGQTLDPDSELLASRLAGLVELYRQHGLRVAFAVPPLTSRYEPALERGPLLPLFAEVARRGRCEVWDFAAATPPDRLFRDPSHLSTEGRAHYSQALAVQIARLLGQE